MDNTSADRHDLFTRLAELYSRMEGRYNELASVIGLDCGQCADNCCVSYFQHHTAIEWAYLWHGLSQLDPGRLQSIVDRSQEVVDACRLLMEKGQRPQVMCPLNDQGWCSLYNYRLMICRLHGIPNQVRMPNGQVRHFPGCQMCQGLIAAMDTTPVLDRTGFYIELAELEREFAGPPKPHQARVNMTLAEMVVAGPPEPGT